jgi:hypothetical protein
MAFGPEPIVREIHGFLRRLSFQRRHGGTCRGFFLR